MKRGWGWGYLLAGIGLAMGLHFAAPALPGQTLPPLVLTEADNHQTTNVLVGQFIEVDMKGNLSTGYAWILTSTFGDSVVTNGPSTYVVNGEGGVGVGGTFKFPFLAGRIGTTTLAFEYRRGNETLPLQSFEVTIQALALPQLSIEQKGGRVVIRWPIAESLGYFLEGADNLANPQWAALNVFPLPDGANYAVNLGVQGRALFFRLRHL